MTNFKGSVNVDEILDGFEINNDISLEITLESKTDIFRQKKREAWNELELARCDLKPCVKLCKQSGISFIASWHKSVLGRTLVDIKHDDSMIKVFADQTCYAIKSMIGDNLEKGNFAICTTPRRRNKERNFATLISFIIAERFNIPFYHDVALAKNRQRVNAEFIINNVPSEQNIIVFDDFVTTGQTLKALFNALKPLGKNLIFFSGINNN